MQGPRINAQKQQQRKEKKEEEKEEEQGEEKEEEKELSYKIIICKKVRFGASYKYLGPEDKSSLLVNASSTFPVWPSVFWPLVHCFLQRMGEWMEGWIECWHQPCVKYVEK